MMLVLLTLMQRPGDSPLIVLKKAPVPDVTHALDNQLQAWELPISATRNRSSAGVSEGCKTPRSTPSTVPSFFSPPDALLGTLQGFEASLEGASGTWHYLHEPSNYEFCVTPVCPTGQDAPQGQAELKYKPLRLGAAEGVLPEAFKAEFRFLRQHAPDLAKDVMGCLEGVPKKDGVE
ncbi:unnamed protein product [Ostreobium quekettii]|uniref:Uncharacterized protein n=1 Tax=Ostreobium quekettii TaxID=121088 RepID=A0A8S1J8P3_9CHLO|nr:unnamed protein product [Ostreobium quekettii]